jgi:molybdate transport system regulatory protein
LIRGELTVQLESGLKINTRLVELLRIVDKTGSLNTAVKELGLSYSYAWNTLYKINCMLETPLLNTKRGGKGGGVAHLTEAGKQLVYQYEKLLDDFSEFLKTHKIVI